ncbi:MAG: coproporphyrinogen dehydrogenase HemZ [Lachnospiraceae bacterium]|nr:coproporphyrinogen dehydrogenase HemZ [Lachnospiraceae bacterium]
MNIKINDESFAYDVFGLVQAFYPGTKPKMFIDKEADASEETVAIFISEDRITLTIDGGSFHSVSIDPKDRADTKNRLKRLIYETLSDRTKKTLPWGTLTGIRPTKIPYKKLYENKTKEEIFSFMEDTYLCTPEKIRLAYAIARREKEAVGDTKDRYALYIGIPFCPSICLYCSFSSYPYGVYKDRVEAYLDALIKEIRFVGDHFHDRILDTVYIGGGTPTSLSAEELERLLGAVDAHLDLSRLREYTVEAGRPDSVTEEKLKVLLKHGVNRISINPQTMQDKTLKKIGRFHSTEDIRKAYGVARALSDADIKKGGRGFLINMDLIVGLPGENKEDIRDTLEQVKAMEPDNLTVHSLAIKRSSRLHEMLTEYEDELFLNSNEIMDMVYGYADSMGMQPYYLYRQKQISGNMENVGFAPDKKECLYNMEIMEELLDIVAIGAGSDCKKVEKYADGQTDLRRKVERCENVKDVDAYIERIDEMIERKKTLFKTET